MQGYQDLKIKSVETITLTPAIAENLLQKNNGNRKLQPATVNRYAKTMRSGNWRSTHQGIAIDESGNILDGQHRLEAVVKSGVTIITTLTIYKGKLKAGMLPVDIGKNRTSHDLTGLASGEIAIYNAITYLFSNANGSKADPVMLKYMGDNSKPELEYMAEISGIPYNTTPAGFKSKGLSRIWNGDVKAACLAAVIGNIDITIITGFNEEPISNTELSEYYDFYNELQGMAAGTRFILTVMPMFWNLLKYKKFVSQSEYDTLDRNRSELRKIFQKKYAEIFS